MYEQLSKQEFIERTRKEIAVSEEMLKWVDEHYWAIVKKFDGKVFNKRFFNALYETIDIPVVFRHSTLEKTLMLRKTQRRQWHPTPVLLPRKSHG